MYTYGRVMFMYCRNQHNKATKLRLKINLKKDEREILEVMDMFMA